MTQKSGKDVKAHTQYRLKSGKRVKSVTTILQIINKPALLYWAWDLGMQGIDYQAFRDDKANIGSLVHHLILSHLKNLKPDRSGYTPEQVDMAETCFLKYLDWEANHSIEPILIETPLVSEEYAYGGTPDNYCILDGKFTVIDYKSSKAIYKEMVYQLAAYKQLVMEQDETFIVEQAMILRVGRDESEGFEERMIMDLSKAWEAFYHAMKLYEADKKCSF